MLTSPIHKTPTLIACIPFIIGISISHSYDFSPHFLYQILIVLAILVIVLQFFKTQRRSFINGIHLALFILSFLILGYLRYQQENKENDFKGPIKSEFIATVLSTPMNKAKSYRVDLMIDSAFSDSIAYQMSTKIISYIEKSPQVLDLIPGQRIHFESMLNPPSGMMNPEDFDYRAYLQRKSIFATTYIPSDNWHLRGDEKRTLKIRAARIQNHVVNLLKDLHYDEKEMALLSALTVGYKQMIGDDQRQSYVSSGASHILAVSGLHVGIIFLFLTRIFKIFGKSRKVVIMRLLIIITLLWCFAFITGLAPSVTRATLMFSLVSIGTASQQRSSIFNTIYLSALILLVLDPHLIFDIGFQLSYCAVLGIVAFQPYLAKIFVEKLHLPNFLSDLMSVSIAAQLGTAPISIHAFNSFPNYFILTNIWIIPLVGVIVNLAIIVIIVALIGLPTTWIAFPLEWLLKGMNMGVELISSLPYSLNSFLYIDKPTVLLLYGALAMLIFALDYHSKRYLFSFVVLLIVTLGYNAYTIEQEKDKCQLVIFSDRSTFNIAARQGYRSNILIEQDSIMRMPSYFTHHHLAKHTLDETYLKTSYKNYNLQVLNDFIITPNHLQAVYAPTLDNHSDSINITSLILHKEEPKSIYRFYEHFKFKNLVIYQRPEKHINYYRNFCEKEGVELHLVYKEGAYLKEF